MIRRLTEKDRETVLAYAGKRPAENLFIIGDIEAFGFNSDVVTVWGDFDQNGALASIMLRYRENYIPYAEDPERLDGEAWGRILRQDSRRNMVSGIEEYAAGILPFAGRSVKSRKVCYYARRPLGRPVNRELSGMEVKMLFPEEADRIIALRREIAEFTGTTDERPEVLRENMEKGISRTFYIEKNDEPVSAVSTTAETGQAAMIIGVCTRKDWEHRGLATKCLTKLIGVLQAEHKEPCLFYTNPAAGRIYKKLGFIDIGKWMMAGF